MQPITAPAHRWSGWPHCAAALIVACVLVTSCSGASPSLRPSASEAGPASASATAAVPTASSAPTEPIPSDEASPPLAEPTPEPTPTTPPPTVRPTSAARSPGWTVAGSMTIDRLATHALALPNGRVLVVGNDAGLFGSLRDDSARADLGAGSQVVWTPAASLNAPRGEFATVTLTDGRVLVTGGANQGTGGCSSGEASRLSFSSTYVFDPAANAWTRTGLLSTARTDPAIALLPDGRVLVAGGYFRTKPDSGLAPGGGDVRLAASRDGVTGGAPLADVEPPTLGHALATAEVFDPRTGTWTATGSMRYARYGAIAVTLSDGRVLVAGSQPGSGIASIAEAATATAELYDPATGRFTAAGAFPAHDLRGMFPGLPAWVDLGAPAPLDNGRLVALPGGDALLVGNTGWWKHEGEVTRNLRFHVATRTWTLSGTPWLDVWNHVDPPQSWTSGTSRYGASAVALADGRVLVAGGSTGIQYQGELTRSALVYGPAADRWTDGPVMPVPRAFAAAVRLTNGDVMLVGGHEADDARWPTCDDAGGTAAVLRFVP